MATQQIDLQAGLTVQSLVEQLGLELLSGHETAASPVRWVHCTELADPTPWLRGGELLLTAGAHLADARSQRGLIDVLAANDIAGLGFGVGLAHDTMPQALVRQARKHELPLFEVPTEMPFIAITERVYAQLLDERHELLQRSLAGEVLAEALAGGLTPDELRLRLRPFRIGESVTVLVFSARGREAPWLERVGAVSSLEKLLRRERVDGLVAVSKGMLCAVIDGDASPDPVGLARQLRAELGEMLGDVAAAASRPAPSRLLRLSFQEARYALDAARRKGNREVGSWEDLGAVRLLLSLQDDELLRGWWRGVLGPIEREEGEYGDELLRSLDVFIEHNGHWERAAAALYCHRHTLRYRIKRIEQLLDRDLGNAAERVECWLALRGRELTR
ncbi:MAG TPA: PucR family transcriptional regulator ligand-binding domain-containing protein [Solirubrobacteraceae bacterium]